MESSSVQSFLHNLNALSSTEEQINMCLKEMKRHLEEGKHPNVRQFWEVRCKCLELFKGKLAARKRMGLWANFVSLSEEMRAIRDVLDCQGAFAVEQIKLAMHALQRDIEGIDQKITEIPPIDFPSHVRLLKGQRQAYLRWQQEIELLNHFAGRLHSLRKELLHTPLRARDKHRLLGELSGCEELVFPRRKQAIRSLSEDFSQRVNTFFIDRERLRDAKEEIKALQALAKALAIGSNTFSQVREVLSSFWDQINEWEKERQEKKAQEREQLKKNLEMIFPKVELLKQRCLERELTVEKAREIETAILDQMGHLSFSPAHIRLVKEKLAEAMEPVEKERAEELKEQQKQERQALQERAKGQESLLHLLSELLDRAETLSLEHLVEQWETFVKQEKELDVQGAKGKRIAIQLDAVYDQIQDQRWRSLQQASSEGEATQLHTFLDDRHRARRKLKERLEDLRKCVGASGLSMGDSLLYQEMIREEKYRLDAIDTMIEEIERKLFDVRE